MKTKPFWILLAICAGCTTNGPALRLGAPAPDKSRVVFFRTWKYLASLSSFDMHEDERLIGSLSGSSFFVYDCAPGKHFFCTSMGNAVTLQADLLPGKTYYVKCEYENCNAALVCIRMTPVNPNDPRWNDLSAMLGKLGETHITPQQVAHDREGAANFLKRVREKGVEQGALLPEYGYATPLEAHKK